MEIKSVKPTWSEAEHGRRQIANLLHEFAPNYNNFSVCDEVNVCSIDILLKLADTALAEGNVITALEQYVIILRHDPANIRALYGRIVAEGHKFQNNLPQVINKIDNILNKLEDYERNELLRFAERDLLLLGRKAEREYLKAFFQDITPESYKVFASQMEEILVFYKNSLAISPSQAGILMAMIDSAQRLMVPYRNQKTGRKIQPTKVTYNQGKKWLQEARELLKKSFPSLFERLRYYKKYSNCFIVTAAWGDPIADEVIMFRSFRDLYLRRNPVGRRLIFHYYQFGPIIAANIIHKPVLRYVVRVALFPLLLGIKCLPGIGASKSNIY